MTTQTTNYSFTKDDINEPYDVLRVNANLDAIDTEIKKKETQIGDKANLVTVTKTNLVAAINEVKEQTNDLATNKADLVNGKIPSIQLPNIEVPVQSVNSKTGAVVLTKTDIGLGNVDNSVDSAKAVLSATKLATPRAINGVNFDGTANITIADGTKAPTSHASTGTGYGIGTTANYGHVKTINGLTQASHVDGLALSAYQGKLLNDNIKIENATLITTITLSHASATDITSYINNTVYNELYFVLDGTVSISSTYSTGLAFQIGFDKNTTISNSVNIPLLSAYVKSSYPYTLPVMCKIRYVRAFSQAWQDTGTAPPLEFIHETGSTSSMSISSPWYLRVCKTSGYITSSGNVTLKIYGLTRSV